MTPAITRWDGCYRESWQEGDITPASFAHPAKVAKGLAFRIIRHLITQGYLQAGQLCLDPFAGIGGFALPCLSYGLRFCGVELEPKFQALAQQNLDLWWHRYGFTGGTVVQGDSRQLRQVLAGAETACVVGSPPFVGSLAGEPRHDHSVLGQMQRGDNRTTGGTFGQSLSQHYGHAEGQLGALPPGTPPACVVSSPPYAESAVSALDATAASGGQGNAYRRTGKSPRVRKAMLNEQYNAAALVSSPPYAGSVHDGNGIDQTKLTGNRPGQHTQAKAEGYGSTPGQLGAMPAGAVVSSPPWEDQLGNHDTASNYAALKAKMIRDGHSHAGRVGASFGADYGTSLEQLGNTTGDTFWSAASQIDTECVAILPVGGHRVLGCERVRLQRQAR